MTKRLTRHGNSFALVIDKPVLDLLGVDTETPFEITTDGQVLVLTPVRDASRQAAFRDALESVNARFPRALKKLAE